MTLEYEIQEVQLKTVRLKDIGRDRGSICIEEQDYPNVIHLIAQVDAVLEDEEWLGFEDFVRRLNMEEGGYRLAQKALKKAGNTTASLYNVWWAWRYSIAFKEHEANLSAISDICPMRPPDMLRMLRRSDVAAMVLKFTEHYIRNETTPTVLQKVANDAINGGVKERDQYFKVFEPWRLKTNLDVDSKERVREPNFLEMALSGELGSWITDMKKSTNEVLDDSTQPGAEESDSGSGEAVPEEEGPPEVPAI